MTDLNRRHLGGILLGVGASAALAGCAATASTLQAAVQVAENGVKKFATTVTTDLASLTTQWGTIKGIGQVAVTALTASDPVAAAAINTAIGLGETAIDFLTKATTQTAAADVQNNVQAVLDNISQIITNAQGAFDAVKAAA